jgi:hypothetical protein
MEGIESLDGCAQKDVRLSNATAISASYNMDEGAYNHDPRHSHQMTTEDSDMGVDQHDDPLREQSVTLGSGGANSDHYESLKEREDDNLLVEEAETSRRILIVRILFSVVLVISTIGIAVAVYYFVREMETREFEYHFRSDADKITQSLGYAMRTTLASADVLATNFMAHKDATNSSFPFVSLPHFPLQVAKLKLLSRAYVSGAQFWVSDEQRDDWEAFAAEHGPLHVDEAWKLQAQDETFQGPLKNYPPSQDQIYTNFPEFSVIPRGNGPYLVKWQTYPIVYEVNSAPYNYDMLTFPTFANDWNTTLQTKRPSLAAFSVVDISDPLAQIGIEYLKLFISEDESAAEPVTSLIYPILDQNGINLQHTNESIEEADLVGTVSFGFFWRDLLRDILPEKSEGILVVTEMSCNMVNNETVAFTYEINGAYTTYLGVGDLSKPEYHYLRSSKTLNEIMDDISMSTSRQYTGIRMSESSCPIRITIYPSAKNESSFYGSQPLILTICSVLVFLFAGILFALYDLLVKRRQRKVADIAAKSSAIVSDLFPKEVHNRLYEAKLVATKENSRKIGRISSAVASLQKEKNSLSSHSMAAECSLDGTSIADVYPCKTYLCCDGKCVPE